MFESSVGRGARDTTYLAGREEGDRRPRGPDLSGGFRPGATVVGRGKLGFTSAEIELLKEICDEVYPEDQNLVAL